MPAPSVPTERIGRYVLYGPIASGGMATVHFGRMLSEGGPARTVAIKRLHPHLATESEFLAMLVDEGRLATRLRDPHLVTTVEVVVSEAHVLLVMEYVHGVSLSVVTKRQAEEGLAVPAPIAGAILVDALRGLHAAHEASDERGRPLGIVHRDVSPPNILVGADGHARVADFGIAKAVGRLQTTRDGQLKGKLSYMAPEQLSASAVDRRTDVYAASIVLWELLVGRRLFVDETGEVSLTKVMGHVPAPPSRLVPALGTVYDDVVLRGLERDPRRRFSTAKEMADALEAAGPIASRDEVARWLAGAVGDVLKERAQAVAGMEQDDLGAPSAMAMAAPAETAGGRPRWSFVLAVAVLAAATVFALALRAGRPALLPGADPGASAPAALSSPVGPGSGVVAAGEGALADERPTAPASASSSPEPVFPLAPPPEPSASPKAASVRKKPVARDPSPKARGKCDPPYDIDEQGVKRYRPNCL